MKIKIALILAVALVGSSIGATAHAETYLLPRDDFAQCATAASTYCIESVTFNETTGAKVGTWYTPDQDVLDASGLVPSAIVTTTEYAGRWSYANFDSANRHYDGVYVKVAPANEYTDIMLISIEPAGKNSSAKVGRSVRTIDGTSTQVVRDLNPSTGYSINVRLGALTPAVTVAVADQLVVNRSINSNRVPVLSIQGTPVKVPLHSRTADCEGESGSSYAEVYQWKAVVAFTAGMDGFGVSGLSGDMYVSSNGICALSTPTWDNASMQMGFQMAAPHFSSTGAVNRGFYKAFIPATDAMILYGITSPGAAKSDLKLEITSDAYETYTAAKVISGNSRGISISYTGVEFSKPKLTLKPKSTKSAKKLKKKRTKAAVAKAKKKNAKNTK